MKKYFFTLLALLLLLHYLHAQKPAPKFKSLPKPKSLVRKYTPRNGLPLKVINGITQDKEGLIWISAEDGLARFDGNSFKLFKNDPENSYSLSANYVQWIFTDSEGVVWACSSKGLNRFDAKTEQFIRYRHNPADSNSLAGDNVVYISENKNGNLWIASMGDGFTYFDKKKARFISYSPHNLPGLSSEEVELLYEDEEGLLWVGTLGGGLDVFETQEGIVTKKVEYLSRKNLLPSLDIRCLSPDHQGNLWIGTNEGLVFYSRKQNTFYTLNKYNSDLSGNIIRSIGEDSQQNLWIGVEDKGLHRLDLKGFDGHSPATLSVAHEVEEGEYSTYKHTIHAIYEDKDRNLWLGTNGDGVQMISGIPEKFIRIQRKQTGENGGVFLRFWGMCSDKEGRLWLGSDGEGIYQYDNKGNLLRHYYADGKKGSLTNNAILCAFRDHSNTLWFGTYARGLFRYDEQTDSFINYGHDPANPASLGHNDVRVIFEDSRHNLWVGCNGGGLNLLDKNTGTFTKYASRSNGTSLGSVRAIIEDKRGGLWVGCHGEGIHYFDPEKKSLQRYFNGSESKNVLSSNTVFALRLDSQQKLWIGTEGAGLVVYDPAKETLQQLDDKKGMGGSSVYALLADPMGNFWMSTNTGISRWEPRQQKFYNYDGSDGLQNGQFNSSSFLYDTTSGLMGFAGTEGVTVFHPNQVKQNLKPPELMITGFQLFNKPVAVIASGGKGAILKQAINQTKEITLRHDQSVFTFEFTALNYAYPEKCSYAYKMEGFDQHWNDVGFQRTATYTNLDPGEYTFTVKASNDDGVWNEKGTAIKIIITPPLWATWWFETLVVVIIIGGAFSFYRYRINSVKAQKMELEKQVMEQTTEVMQQKKELQSQAETLQVAVDELQKQKEALQQQREEAEKARKEAEQANKAKSIFLATMSHEIRTPMNGVLGMASLLAETPLTTEQREYTDTIRGSGDALLTVINDILDFSKIESGNMELDHHAFDLRQCLEDVMDIFSTKAAQKGLDLVYQIDYQIPAQIVGDSHRLRQVLINLIGNAMKFTERGEIFVGIDLLHQNNEQLELALQIRDTGIGIAQDKLSRLFQAFSQVDSSTTRKYGGTGLGLVIAQRLVELMGGHIAVESQQGVGTSFGFIIKALVSQESIRQYVNTHLVGSEGRKVLVVDDNVTNLAILKTQLEQWKLVPTLASSGALALQILAQQEKFDLVITDMQMPDMDGVQLTQRIKAEHAPLPVILLSSIGDESKKKYPRLFSAVLNKPVKQQQFKRVLHAVFRPDGESTPVEEQKSKQVLSEDFATKYPLRILVADDNPVNQKLIIRVLNKLGYQQIEVAKNGLEAVEKFDEQFYDVILMDVQMPEMDGLEATRMIRLKQYLQPVIISMTANAMQGDREECIKAGMDDYISKPVKFESLVDVFEKWASTIKDNGSKAAG